MHNSRRLAGVAALVAVALWASDAAAFCRSTTCEKCVPPDVGCITEGLPLYWPAACASYDMQNDASKWASLDVATGIVETAFAAWTGATCDNGQHPSLTFTNMGPVMCTAREFNDGKKRVGGNANIIVFRDDVWTSASVSDPASTLALTTVTFSVSTGQIYDADIEVNGSTTALSTDETPSAGAFDLLSILTHEAGHFLGLAHSTVPCGDGNDCPTMNALYRRGSSAYRSLEPDDQAGMCAIYPAGRSVTSQSCTPYRGQATTCGTPPDPNMVEPPGGCTAAGQGPRSNAAAGLLAALGLLMVVGRARRRRDRRSAGGGSGGAAGATVAARVGPRIASVRRVVREIRRSR